MKRVCFGTEIYKTSKKRGEYMNHNSRFLRLPRLFFSNALRNPEESFERESFESVNDRHDSR